MSPSVGTPEGTGLVRLNERDRDHRLGFASYAANDGLRAEEMAHFYDRWRDYNRRYWEGRLTEPPILIAVPTSNRALGDCATVSGWGSPLQIRIRPTVLTGEDKGLREGAEFAEGRLRYADDVLLHEMVHQYQYELAGEPEDSYHGHGPVFRDECNRIGAALGLPPVRTAKKRGPDAGLPSCKYWPRNVRPPEYYLGALADPEPATPPPPPVPTITVPCDPAGLVAALALALDEAAIRVVWHDLKAHVLPVSPRMGTVTERAASWLMGLADAAQAYGEALAMFQLVDEEAAPDDDAEAAERALDEAREVLEEVAEGYAGAEVSVELEASTRVDDPDALAAD